MPFRYKSGANAGERFGGADYQKTIGLKDVGYLVEEFFPVFKSEINGHIATQNYVKFTESDKGLH